MASCSAKPQSPLFKLTLESMPRDALGEGQVVNTAKALAGAGTANRLAELFDDDSAAHAALSWLEGVMRQLT